MANHVLKTLIKRDNGVCHYCKQPTKKTSPYANPRGTDATREHIVPRAFGGPNTIDNFVLACASCNHRRGNFLFFCECRDCTEKILDFIYDSDNIRRIFDSMIAHNKPLIRRRPDERTHPPGKPWYVKIGYNKRHFASHAEAIEFIQDNTLVKDVV